MKQVLLDAVEAAREPGFDRNARMTERKTAKANCEALQRAQSILLDPHFAEEPRRSALVEVMNSAQQELFAKHVALELRIRYDLALDGVEIYLADLSE